MDLVWDPEQALVFRADCYCCTVKSIIQALQCDLVPIYTDINEQEKISCYLPINEMYLSLEYASLSSNSACRIFCGASKEHTVHTAKFDAKFFS